MDLGLKGLRAFVTGSSRGLGYATARQLALEGADVCINSRDAERVEKAANLLNLDTKGKVIGICGDVMKSASCFDVVQKSVDAMGGLDILVTNAGGPPPGKFESISDDVWQKAVDATLMSHVWLIRAALPYLKA